MSTNNKNKNECYWHMVGLATLLGTRLIVVDSLEARDTHGRRYSIGPGLLLWGEGTLFSQYPDVAVVRVARAVRLLLLAGVHYRHIVVVCVQNPLVLLVCLSGLLIVVFQEHFGLIVIQELDCPSIWVTHASCRGDANASNWNEKHSFNICWLKEMGKCTCTTFRCCMYVHISHTPPPGNWLHGSLSVGNMACIKRLLSSGLFLYRKMLIYDKTFIAYLNLQMKFKSTK